MNHSTCPLAGADAGHSSACLEWQAEVLPAGRSGLGAPHEIRTEMLYKPQSGYFYVALYMTLCSEATSNIKTH